MQSVQLISNVLFRSQIHPESHFKDSQRYRAAAKEIQRASSEVERKDRK